MKNLFSVLLLIPIITFCQNNNALTFDGIDDWVDVISFNHSENTDMTIRVNAKGAGSFFSTEVSGYQTYFSYYPEDNYGAENYVVYHNGAMGNWWEFPLDYDLSDDFHDFVLTINSSSYGTSSIEFFLDGISYGAVSYSTPVKSSSGMVIGENLVENSGCFDGTISKIQMWEGLLTYEEIQSLSSGNDEMFENEFIANWDFNQGEDPLVLYDKSNNSFDGFINGATYTLLEGFYGCLDYVYLEYNPDATLDDGSCGTLLSDTLNSLNNHLEELIIEASNSISSLQQAIDTWNTKIDLDDGWNMFGYGCPESINLIDGVSNYSESIMIVKDDWGLAYLPEYGFNGIGDLTPGAGYQIKLSQAIDDFSLCDWYVNDVPEDNIVTLQEEVEELQEELSNIHNGCTESLACNYNSYHIYDDGSCEYPDTGYNCAGNIVEPYIGMSAYGGIVFYVDCYNGGLVVDTTAYNQMTWNEALDYSSNTNGYSDWFLPALSEFDLLYEIISEIPFSLLEESWTSTPKNSFTSYSSIGNSYLHNSQLNVTMFRSF